MRPISLLHGLPLLLSGCLTLDPVRRSPDSPPPASSNAVITDWSAETFQLDGRFALRYPRPDRSLESGANQQASGRFTWDHQAEHDQLVLSDPLGRGIAAIDRRPGQARLTTATGEEHLAADADTLLQQVSGLPLPINALADWLSNRNPNGEPLERLADGRPSRRHSQGWWITYDYVAGTATPRRITARWGDDLELRLAIENWQNGPTATPHD